MDLHKTAIRRKLLKDVKKGIFVGSTHKAHCKCGFETEVIVGGGMYDFHKVSYFPHYCENCGLVAVNIAKSEAKGIVPTCPECGNSDLQEYGTQTACVPVTGNQVALEWGTYHARATAISAPLASR